MFTFTLYKHGNQERTVLSGHKYNVEDSNGYTVLSVFPTHGADGDCYYIDHEDFIKSRPHVNGSPFGDHRQAMSYGRAFVTNEAGKTIDNIGPCAYDESKERKSSGAMQGQN